MLSGQYILDNEDFATTANKGTVKMATDAETITGTDTEIAVTPANIAALLNVRNIYTSVVTSGTSVNNTTSTVATYSVPANTFAANTTMRVVANFDYIGNVSNNAVTINLIF